QIATLAIAAGRAIVDIGVTGIALRRRGQTIGAEAVIELGRRAIGAELGAHQWAAGDQAAIGKLREFAVKDVVPHRTAGRHAAVGDGIAVGGWAPGSALRRAEHLQLLRILVPAAWTHYAVDARFTGEFTGEFDMRPAAQEAGAGGELNLCLRIVGIV